MPRRVLHDRYFRQAKADGFVARSAYKLIEIDDKFRLLRKADRVIDLGCAPGSWLQVIAQRIGPRGRAVGIDLQPVDIELAPNITTLVADLTKADPADLLAPLAHPAHVVVSDMAPNTTGHGDSERSIALCRDAVALLPAILRPGGHFAIKALEGGPFPDLLAEVRRSFQTTKPFKPKASRDISREIFIVAKGFKPIRNDL